MPINPGLLGDWEVTINTLEKEPDPIVLNVSIYQWSMTEYMIVVVSDDEVITCCRAYPIMLDGREYLQLVTLKQGKNDDENAPYHVAEVKCQNDTISIAFLTLQTEAERNPPERTKVQSSQGGYETTQSLQQDFREHTDSIGLFVPLAKGVRITAK